MSEIEKMKKYIDRNGAPHNLRYDVSSKEILALVCEMEPADAVCVAVSYGRAKGYQQAKAERRARA